MAGINRSFGKVRFEQKLLIPLLLTAFLAAATLPAAAEAASDPRFFGTYCGTYEKSYEVPVCVPLLPFICWKETRTVSFSVTANAKYRELSGGEGLVYGTSLVEGEGRRVPVVFSGVVTSRGELKGSGSAPGISHITASASLSGNGRDLTIKAYDHRIVLHKDECGNTPPSAAITTHGDSFPYGRLNYLRATASDSEDAAFADRRLIWKSSRDVEWRKYGYSANITDLSPGDHTITFTAIDSGGMQASVQKSIRIANRIPEAEIISPSNGETFFEGQSIPFVGWATDTELGNLTDREGSLVWSYGDGILIGTGSSVSCELPVGNHDITLSASDGAATGSDSVSISVNQEPTGNTPPTVSISRPARYYAFGNGPDDCIVCEVDVAHDNEDGVLTGNSLVWKAHMEGADEPKILSSRGRRIIACQFSAGDTTTKHTITVTATDSDGASTTSAPREIFVIPVEGGLY